VRQAPAALLVATILLNGPAVPGAPAAAPAAGSAQGAQAAQTDAKVPAGPKDVAATVDGRPITMERLTAPLIEAYGLNVLLNLVRLELAQQAAEEARVTVSEDDVAAERDRTLAKMFQDAEKADYDKLFEQFLTQQRISRTEFDIVLRTNAHLRKVAEPLLAGKITDQSLEEAFRTLYGEKVRVRHIQGSNLQEIGEAKRRLDEGQPFEQVARQLSRNARTRAAGGELPEFTRATPTLPEAFKNAAFSMKEGEVSDAIMADGAYHLIKVEQKIQPKAVKFEDVKESIRQDLTERATQAVVNDLRQQNDKKALATIKIMHPELQRQFDQRKQQQEAAIREQDEIRKQWEKERRGGADAGAATQPATDDLIFPDSARPTTLPAATGAADAPANAR
jgi:parvulin-like peptidyl-prolyl isomerase